MNAEEFKQYIQSKIPYGCNFKMPGGISDLMYINFYNVPQEDYVSIHDGGAYFENNRFSFSIRGFNKNDNANKISIEISVCVASKEFRKLFRKKTTTPEKIADYLINYLNKIKSEIKTSSSGKYVKTI